MQFWQSLAFIEADQLIPAAEIAEEMGFEGVMISDHLIHFERIGSRYPYSPDGTPPSFTAETVWPESWSIIAALAAVTRRLRFLTNVYILPLRNPIEVAKATSSVASFFEGRVAVGAGAGWMKEEFDLLGVDFDSRGKRFDECIEVMRKLWTGKMVEHHGAFFDFPRIQMCPVPREPIPIYIGGMSPAALRRTARLGDGWLGAGQTIEQALETLKRLGDLRAAAGRAAERFEAIVPIIGPPDLDAFRRLEDAGAAGTTSFPFTFTLGPTSTLEQKRRTLERFANDVISKLRH